MKVAREIKENTWFEKTIKRTQNNRSLSEEQLKTILYDAMTYYLSEDIPFHTFLEIIQALAKRSEINTLPEIKHAVDLLNPLSKYKTNPKTHREEIIDSFYKILTRPLT